jgi:stearoyl-CoA desaturase (delta-9 desaturase)
VLFVLLYVPTCLGITIGFHRLFTHRAFKTSAWMRGVLAVCGTMAIEGPVISWVADHRKHHAYSDRLGDPHSPHVDHGGGWRGALRGLAHAHVGWLFDHQQRGARERFAPDLIADPVVSFVDRTFILWSLVGLAIPFGLGWLIGGTLAAALEALLWAVVDRLFIFFALLGLAIPFGLGWWIGGTLQAGLDALLWGGAVRILLLHHVTYSINSLCHFFGRRRYATTDHSRNLAWLAPFSMGEAWHNNHHAFPTSAFHGMRRGELDLSGLVILGMERAGLVWDVQRVSPERRAAKAISP